MSKATISLIVDTDMGIDDWMALIYLLKHPQVRIMAVTVVGNGLSTGDLGVKNALSLVKLAGQSNIPVAWGSPKPLKGNHSFPKEWQITDGIANEFLIPPDGIGSVNGDAINMIIDTISKSEDDIVILALGPLTNLAQVVTNAPEVVKRIRMIYIMGGAIGIEGNVGLYEGVLNHKAEWNIFIDPNSVNILLKSGAPITLIPLNATNCTPVTESFLDRLSKEATSPQAKVILKILQFRENDIRDGQFYFWDPLAAAIATDESIATINEGKISVIEEEGLECGRTLDDEDGIAVRFASVAKLHNFEEIYLKILNA